MITRSRAKKPRHTENFSVPPYREDGDQTLNLTVTYAGKNFAFWFADTNAGHTVLGGPNWSADRSKTGSASILGGHVPFNGLVPDLDVTNQIYIHVARENEKDSIMLNMSGDGFPNAESCIIDATGNKSLALQPIFARERRSRNCLAAGLYECATQI